MANNTNSGDFALKALAEKVFGTKVQEIVKEKKMSYRDIWETSSPSTQCGNIIGRVTKKTECWLCGYLIDTKIDDFTPECEHVLPVGQALIFLDLYKHSVHKDKLTDELKSMLELEYKWAHKVCNRVKSDTNFLGFEQDGTPIVLKKVITEYLKEIYRNSGHLTRIVGTTKQNKDSWQKQRLADISDKIQKIIEHINVKTMGLLLLSGTSSLFEPANIASSLRDSITVTPDEVVPNIKPISRSLNISEFRRLRYYIEFKSNLTSVIDDSAEVLTAKISEAIKEKDTDSKFIKDLRAKYGLTRSAEYNVAIKELLLAIVRDRFAVNLENIMHMDAFKGLFYTYSLIIRADGIPTYLFNPFMTELISLCILCLIQDETSKYHKLQGALDKETEGIKSIWVARCKDAEYKLFFCRTMELFIKSGAVIPQIIPCIKSVDCSKIDTKMENVIKHVTKINALNVKKPVTPPAVCPSCNSKKSNSNSRNSMQKLLNVVKQERSNTKNSSYNNRKVQELLDELEKETNSNSNSNPNSNSNSNSKPKHGGKAKRSNVKFNFY